MKQLPVESTVKKHSQGGKIRWWSIKLSVALMLSFGLLMAVSLTVVLGIALTANFRNTFELLNDKTINAIESVNLVVDNQFQPAEFLVRDVARRYEDGAFDLENMEVLEAVLTTVLTANRAVDGIFIYKKDLTRFGAFRSGIDQFQFVAGDKETSAEIIESIRSTDPNAELEWGRPVFSIDDVYMNVSAPLKTNGQTEAFVVAAIGTRHIANRLNEFTKSDQSEDNLTLFVLHGGDTVIAHSNPLEYAFSAKITNLRRPVPISVLGDPVLEQLPKAETLDAFRKAKEAGISVLEIPSGDPDNDIPSIAMTKTIKSYGPVDWTLGVYANAATQGSEIRRLLASAIAGLIAIVIAMIAAFFIAKRISRTIVTISDQAMRVANLELNGLEEVKRSRITEIDQGATAFNAMLTALRAFTTYVPRSLVARLIDQGIEEAGRSREIEITVLFTDIVSFTALSEKLPTTETARLLNKHFEILVEHIDAEGGTVDKFMGDGLLAFWGAPIEDPDHAQGACRAAHSIIAAVEKANDQARAIGEEPIKIRIGVHTGKAIVGNVGAFDRVNYTIIGDTVNVCARLQQLGKTIAPDADAIALVSEETYERAMVNVEHAGQFALRGREKEVDVWRLVAGRFSKKKLPASTDQNDA